MYDLEEVIRVRRSIRMFLPDRWWRTRWSRRPSSLAIRAPSDSNIQCELSADGKTRTLSLKRGGTIVEALVKMDAAGRSYTYSIVSAPLPVANYTSTISVVADGAGSTVTWAGKYDAKGASDADSKKAIDGVYDSGLKALTAN